MAQLPPPKPCQRCGTMNPDTAKFCQSCGLQLGPPAPQFAVQPPMNQQPMGMAPAKKPVNPGIMVLCVLGGMFGLCGLGTLGVFILGARTSEFDLVKTVIGQHASATSIRYGDTVERVDSILGSPETITADAPCTDDPTEKDLTCSSRYYARVVTQTERDQFRGCFRGDKLIGGIEDVTHTVTRHMTFDGSLVVPGRPAGAYDLYGSTWYTKTTDGHEIMWDEFGKRITERPQH